MDVDEPCTCPVPLTTLLNALPEPHQLDGPTLVAVAPAGGDELDIAIGPVPEEAGHPAEALVGFRFDPRWHAAGMIVRGTSRAADASGRPRRRARPQRVELIVLAARDGHVATSMRTGGTRQVIESPPTGWSADALARSLGRPTPPPEQTRAALVDALWLADLLANAQRRGVVGRRPWRELARSHPFRGSGPVPTPRTLADRAIEHGVEHAWDELLASLATATEQAAAMLPPDLGHAVPLGEWFDAGSLSRWMLQCVPPAAHLTDELLGILHPEDGLAVVSALAEPPLQTVA